MYIRQSNSHPIKQPTLKESMSLAGKYMYADGNMCFNFADEAASKTKMEHILHCLVD